LSKNLFYLDEYSGVKRQHTKKYVKANIKINNFIYHFVV